ncbi:MAG: NAD-dependent epimerase/dehydratase [Parcubacteria group bacterium GW2011_GWC2_39_11]|nr:MAG: NAD-dependent epimerase/dehydratase [Parcubacteria group bacterium GW2011_GWA2_38_27]KKQ98470.1 MAG: NAD-dependent epimerase/dehydratase [Parcubacteria group bacterium GW2011_GWC2_39_11]
MNFKFEFKLIMEEFFKGKKILVAGGAGFIGTNLIKKLLSLGAKVRAGDIRKLQIQDSRAEYLSCDFFKKRDCQKAVKDMDYVFMAAANTSGAAVMSKTPLAHVTPNIIMNSLMLESAYKAGVKKFLFISSNTVYPASDQPVRESDMKYGDLFPKYYFVAWMKQFSEVLCEMYTKIKNPMKTVVVRPANSFGPHSDFNPETSHVIPALIKKVVERQNPIEVWGDGNDIKDFIFVEDLVEGMLLAMAKLENYDPINLATGRPCVIKEVLKAILEADNYQNAQIVFNADQPTMIPKRLIDPSKAKEILGFEAKTPLADGIKKTVDWYRSVN